MYLRLISIRRCLKKSLISGVGNIYADEGNHWDILYYNCGC